MKSKLLLNTNDGSLTACTIRPQSEDTQVEFSVRYYRYENGEEQSVSAILRFSQVASVDMEINFFDNPIGAELGGFYEILDEDFKKQMLEKVFRNRKDGYLFHGDYDYDPEDPGDILNFSHPSRVYWGNWSRTASFSSRPRVVFTTFYASVMNSLRVRSLIYGTV